MHYNLSIDGKDNSGDDFDDEDVCDLNKHGNVDIAQFFGTISMRH